MNCSREFTSCYAGYATVPMPARSAHVGCIRSDNAGMKQRWVALTLDWKVQLIKQTDLGIKPKGKLTVGICASMLSNILKDEKRILDGFEQRF